MMLHDVIKAVDQFSPDELRQLREYIEEREHKTEPHGDLIDVEALLSGLEEIREGVSEEEFAEIERAMNEEYPTLVDN